MVTRARASSGGKLALDLGGNSMGLVQSAEGGGVFADVITFTDVATHKIIGPARFEDFTIQIGFGLVNTVYQWIANSWTHAPEHKNGSLITTDANLRSRTQRDFTNALLVETTVPTLDAALREAAWLTLRFTPGFMEYRQSSGAAIPKPPKVKQFLSSGFRLEINGLDCTRVTRIESFTVRRKVITATTAGAGMVATVPGAIDFPNIKLSLVEASAPDWAAWAHDLIIDGHNANRKTGTLVLLKPDLSTELARISLFNLGICRLSPEKAGGNTVPKLRAELYCERMDFAIM